MRINFSVGGLDLERLNEAAALRGMRLNSYIRDAALLLCAEDLAPSQVELDPHARRAVEVHAIVKTGIPAK